MNFQEITVCKGLLSKFSRKPQESIAETISKSIHQHLFLLLKPCLDKNELSGHVPLQHRLKRKLLETKILQKLLKNWNKTVIFLLTLLLDYPTIQDSIFQPRQMSTVFPLFKCHLHFPTARIILIILAPTRLILPEDLRIGTLPPNKKIQRLSR